MAIDDVPDPKPSMVQTTKSDHSGRFAAIFVILALLIIGEIYSFTRFSSLRSDLQTQQALLNKRMSAELSNKIQDLQNANAQSLDELRSELDSTVTQMSKSQKTAMARAHYAGYLVKKLEREQNQNAQELRQALAQKADQQQVGSLTQDVSNTKSDLASTKKTMDTLAKDLGMARSNLGTLIATNHQDIVALQKLGQRDYFEFTLDQNQKKTVAGISLVLKHTSTRHHTYNVDMFYNDMKITRKNLAIDQPLFFAPKYTHQFYEMVVYQIAPHRVVGYISTPKGALQEMASSQTQPAQTQAAQ
jgi:ribosomal protein S8